MNEGSKGRKGTQSVMNRDIQTKGNQPAGVTASDARRVIGEKGAQVASLVAGRNLSRKTLTIAVLVIGLAAAGLIGLVSSAFNNSAAKESETPVLTVAVETVTKQPIEQTLKVAGSVTAWDPLSIGAEVNGLKIVGVEVEEGDHVKKGQVLARLNSSIVSAQLDEARARLQACKADLVKAVQPNRPEDISRLKAAYAHAQANVAEAEAHLVQAKADGENARKNAERYRDLRKQGAVSAQDAEDRITKSKTAEANIRAAEQKVRAARHLSSQASERLAMAVSGGRQEDIDIARARVIEMEATVRRLEAQLAQTVIKAPDDGLITKRDAHIGDITEAGTDLFYMVRGHRLELKAEIPEADLAKVEIGQNVRLSSFARPGKLIDGKVREITPVVNPTSRLGTVRIDVPPDRGLMPGMFVQAEVDMGSLSAIAVPAKAVVHRDKESYVFVLNGNKVYRRSVKQGARVDGLVEIRNGLSPGDKVVVAGAGFLKDGDPVRVGK